MEVALPFMECRFRSFYVRSHIRCRACSLLTHMMLFDAAELLPKCPPMTRLSACNLCDAGFFRASSSLPLWRGSLS